MSPRYAVRIQAICASHHSRPGPQQGILYKCGSLRFYENIRSRRPVVHANSYRCRHALRGISTSTNKTADGSESSSLGEHSKSNHKDAPCSNGDSIRSKMLESAATAFASILVLGTGFGLGGYVYHKFYKWLVLHKMEKAFKPGDPVLELAAKEKKIPNKSSLDEDQHWILREQQAKIDAIVSGEDIGHYHLLIGEKGTGKSSMLLDAMQKVDGEGCSMFEAHADLEIFRIRLGKALDFEFHEDYIGSYFSERGPRDTTALLDIERAFNKLEKVALKRRSSVGRPLVLIINSMHLLRDDEDGKDLLELLQQRAEQWAASNLVTVVFNSDDYWVYERLKTLASRMEVTPVGDLPRKQAMVALEQYRMKYFGEKPASELLSEVYERVGGRLAYLNRVAKSGDMLRTCDDIMEVEKTWFLNKCWILGMEMDDDVMDQQKYASSAMILAQALVDAEDEMDSIFDPEIGHILPSLPLHEARQVMTRADFIRSYDHINVFTITPSAQVRADSVPMQRAFRKICNQPGFREHLEATIQRIGDIESLGRTRELVAKDLVLGGRYKISTGSDATGKSWLGGKKGPQVIVELLEKEEDKDEPESS